MKGNPYIQAGQWRSDSEPMKVVSGALGKEKVHFEAPPDERVPIEMEDYSYHDTLKAAQSSNEVSSWLEYFT